MRKYIAERIASEKNILGEIPLGFLLLAFFYGPFQAGYLSSIPRTFSYLNKK